MPVTNFRGSVHCSVDLRSDSGTGVLHCTMSSARALGEETSCFCLSKNFVVLLCMVIDLAANPGHIVQGHTLGHENRRICFGNVSVCLPWFIIQGVE